MMLAPIPILLYHRLDHSGRDTSTPPEVFAGHLAWLAERGYTTLRAGELARILAGEAARPERPVFITFDDGYADLVTEAAPVLRAHDFTATAFLITSLVATGGCGRDSSDDRVAGTGGDAPAPTGRRDHVSWPEVRALAADGLFEFHSHTHSHVRWPLDASQASVVADDIDQSRAVLARELGEPESAFDHLAWPWGRACPAWEDEVQRRGVPVRYVVQRGAANRQGRLGRLPRLMVDGTPVEAFARWMTVLGRGSGAYAANQVFGTIRRVRQGVGYR